MNIFQKIILMCVSVSITPLFLLGSAKSKSIKESVLTPKEKLVFSEMIRQDQLFRSMLAKEKAARAARKKSVPANKKAGVSSATKRYK